MKFNIERIPSLPELLRVLGTGLKRLTFDENMEGQILNIEGQGEIQIQHNLTYIPKYYIILSKSGTGDIYKSNSLWTSDHIYLTSQNNIQFTIWIGR